MKLDKSRHYGLLFVGTETIYVQDGIKFSPKTEEPIDEKEDFVCKVCGKVCKSALGLSGHSRTHSK